MTSVKTTMAQTSELIKKLNIYMESFFKEHGSEEAARTWETESNQVKVKKALLVKALESKASDPRKRARRLETFFAECKVREAEDTKVGTSMKRDSAWKRKRMALAYWCKQHHSEKIKIA